MCGICGVAAGGGGGIGVSRERFVAMRDRLAHRGPDDAGLFEGPGVLLGHRRLSVIDPTPAGSQPMATPDGRFVLVYNGELYNDAEVRAELAGEGVEFRGGCDTETVLHAVARWGAGAAGRMRGMYALALWDIAERRLLIGRDAFGMKPLYWAVAGGAVVFASEIPAVLGHPGVAARPDWAGVSCYLSTIRTTLGERTMYAGVRAVEPGAWLRFELSGEDLEPRRTVHAVGAADGGMDAAGVGGVVADSVRSHLRSDVPWCGLLSGGLDSTVLATLATEEAGALRTYCSGCPGAGDGQADDFAFARVASGAIGSTHTEVPVGEELFVERWPWMVERLGVPMSTPNEVAIHEVAAALRRDGHVVTLSGEGADELFGGYELPLAGAAAHVRERPGAAAREDGAFALGAAAWMQVDQKPGFVTPGFWAESGRDEALVGAYAVAFEEAIDEVEAAFPGVDAGERRMQAFLRLQRRFNLTGLLGRLDTSAMLASVEGRTPFADERVAAAAEGLAMGEKFREGGGTKIALREAFRGRVPAEIAERPKRSFPLPFQGWMSGMIPAIRASGLVREVYTPVAVEMACSDPAAVWSLSWPMANLALWGRRWD